MFLLLNNRILSELFTEKHYFVSICITLILIKHCIFYHPQVKDVGVISNEMPLLSKPPLVLLAFIPSRWALV